MSGLTASWVSRKKKTLRASEQDRPDVAEERDIYGRDIALIDPSRLVFIDETGILTNMTRRFARAVIGERACGSAPANWTRLTVLGALSCDGMVGVMTVPSGTTAVVFVDFLKTTVLPFLQEHELWRKLGDDEVRKAAYRGGRRTCQNLHEGAIRHERG